MGLTLVKQYDAAETALLGSRPPQLGRAPLRFGRHGAEPSGRGFHRSADFGRAD